MTNTPYGFKYYHTYYLLLVGTYNVNETLFVILDFGRTALASSIPDLGYLMYREKETVEATMGLGHLCYATGCGWVSAAVAVFSGRPALPAGSAAPALAPVRLTFPHATERETGGADRPGPSQTAR